MANQEKVLTTTDNPFNPFLDFLSWYSYDHQLGYDTPNYMARLARTSDELPDDDNDAEIDRVMEDIVMLNITGTYIIVTEEDFEDKVGKNFK